MSYSKVISVLVVLIFMFSCSTDNDSGLVEFQNENQISEENFIVVFNDANIFLNDAMLDPNNILLLKNLLTFRTKRLRNDGRTFMFYSGKSTACEQCIDLWDSMQQIILDEGFKISNIKSNENSIIDISADVKIMMLIMPDYHYSVNEINAFKKFASEGGRIIFMGEHEEYYKDVVSIENQFLLNIGASLKNTGGIIDCLDYEGQTPRQITSKSIRKHPITKGVEGLSIGCASKIEIGEGNHPLFFDTTNSYILGGVAKIDSTPIKSIVQLSKSPQSQQVYNSQLNLSLSAK